MKRIVLAALCACSSAPKHVDPIPLPPEGDQPAPQDAGAAPHDISKWPAFPTIADPPISHPTGDPIALPAYLPKVGESFREVTTTGFEQHYVHGDSTRFQRTDTKFDLDVRVLAVEADHPSKLEVTTTTAHETIALADAPTTTPRQDDDLLVGTYIVAADGTVTRGAGVRVQGREQEELAGLFGTVLSEGDSIMRLVRSKQLRVGEVMPLTESDKQKVVGQNAIAGAFTLSISAADARTATYQLDVVSSTTEDKTTTDMRMAGTIKVDRATGRVLELRNQLHKTERYDDSTDDTFSTEVTIFSYH